MKKFFADIDKQWKVYALAACVAVAFAGSCDALQAAFVFGVSELLGLFGEFVNFDCVAVVLVPVDPENPEAVADDRAVL